MKSYLDKLERLGHPMPHMLVVNTVLGSLPNLFNNFVMNYSMQGWDNKSIEELHAMLKTGHKNVPSKIVVSSLHMFRDGGCEIHIFNNVQGMRSSKRLEKGAIVQHMGNENKAEFEAI
ncbi:hypothetical protein Tco_1301558 [Tanacetum coccineum]